MVMRANKKNLIVIFLFLLSIQSPALALDPQAPGSSKATQSDLKSLGVGKIIGRVRVEGRIERPKPLKVFKNREFCGAEVPDESFLAGAGGGLQNAVVTIRGSWIEKPGRPLRRLVLDNRNCAFFPHVQVAQVGSEVLLLNSDPILHDIHARLGSETLFNVGLPSWRQVEKRLTQVGIVTIECEVLHTWMSAYIVVTENPFFAVTDGRGEFTIEGVPVGSYELEVWHEKLGSLLGKVVVAEGRSSRIDLVLPCFLC
jgi:hypothetical protein